MGDSERMAIAAQQIETNDPSDDDQWGMARGRTKTDHQVAPTA
jgi:hypothetical protein